MDNLNGIEYILDAVEAVLTMMMSVETNQKAVAYMLLSCVSTAMRWKCVIPIVM